MENELIPVVKPTMPPLDEYIAEISTIWENRWLTHTGPKHQELQRNLEKYLEVRNVSLFCNGHTALEAILNVLNLRGEVITTPFTFASTTQAILRAGLKPVFCDIEPKTFTIDTNKIERLITNKTVAILPVHVYGNICDYKSIDVIANKYGLKVIYDAAHAFGVTINEKNVAILGDVSMFSFHATKVFHTIEGGAAAFNDGNLVKEFNAWKQYGMYGKENAEMIGTNAKMTEFQAAMGLCNLRHIDEQIEGRKKVVERYEENLKDLKGIIFSEKQKNVDSNYAYFPVLIDEQKLGFGREHLLKCLEEENIYPRKYFYPLTSEFDCCREACNIEETPIAKMCSEQVITLPLYPDLRIDDVDRICAVIQKARI